MPKLGVNIDHIATIREARGGRILYPDPVTAAAIVELAGAHGIVIHLREDRRHIQDRDLQILRKTIQTKLNLEMAVSDEMVEIALKVKPDKVTLVPERKEERTTEGGLDVIGNEKHITEVITRLNAESISCSLFIEPNLEQIMCSSQVGAKAVEFHTGVYASTESNPDLFFEFARLCESAEQAQDRGLIVHMGHGLHYGNVFLVAGIKGIDELNIGHSIVARAVFVGLDQAVREMLALIAG